MSPAEIIVILLTVVAAGLYFYLVNGFVRGWEKLEEMPVPAESVKTNVSVIIPFRNEYKNLGRICDNLSGINYPESLLEVVFVDDNSGDGSADLVEGFIKDDTFNFDVKVLRLSAGDGSGKKAALKKGIGIARGSLIVTTDADCRFGPFWVKSLAAVYEKTSSKIVWGPVRHRPGRGFLPEFYNLEFISLVTSGAGAAGAGKPFLCNGANLAFEKSAFYAVNGYEGNEKYASGDDVFLLHKMKSRFGPAAAVFVREKQAIVDTAPPEGLSSFLSQRIRWASKSTGYRDRQSIMVTVTVFLFNLLLGFLGIYMFIEPLVAIPFVLFALIKSGIDYRLLSRGADFLGFSFNIPLLLVFELVYIPYVVATGVVSVLFSYSWKGRSGVK
jgi:poly-beta-1,6-N-acetyl-D-glucosamine synthase